MTHPKSVQRKIENLKSMAKPFRVLENEEHKRAAGIILKDHFSEADYTIHEFWQPWIKVQILSFNKAAIFDKFEQKCADFVTDQRSVVMAAAFF